METETQKNKLLTDKAMIEIIDYIKSNNLEPGSKLPNEYILAAELDVGRSTLREAIRRLVSRNILDVRQGAGTFVSEKKGVPEDPLGLTFMENDPKLGIDLLDIRLMLEPEIVALVAQNASDLQISEIYSRCSAVEKKIDLGLEYYKEDLALHTYFAECSGNNILKTLIPIIVKSIQLTTAWSMDTFRADTYLQHRQIADFISRHDCIGARASMIEHLNTTRKFFVSMLDQK